jgi:hypothetical protein
MFRAQFDSTTIEAGRPEELARPRERLPAPPVDVAQALRLFLRKIDKETAMALRAGFAVASLLGVVTTFGTTLWVAAVLALVALALGLAAAEGLPRLRRTAGS